MYIRGDSIDDVLNKLYNKLLSRKSNIHPSKGKATEITGVLIKINNPRARLSRTEGKGKVFSALGELLWYMSGLHDLEFIRYYIPKYNFFSDDNKTIYGGYGPRIFGNDNQFMRVIQLLREKKDSRQAIIQIFHSDDLKEKHKDIPCTCTLQFILRNNKLSLIVNMRSNDVFLGFPHDVFAFTMIQEYAASILGCDLGDYKHFVGSLHLYDEHRIKAQGYINEGWQEVIEMPSMPKDNVENNLNILLKKENEIRNNIDIDIDKLELNDYWKDIALMLLYFNARKYKKDHKVINSIMDRINSSAFKVYIKQREDVIKEGPADYDLDGYRTITRMLVRSLKDKELISSGVILNGSPIPAFGKISTAIVATLGLNPSNNEFLDSQGNELESDLRRFHTLKSLFLNDWNTIDDQTLDMIIESCDLYFERNPYDRWFKPLDNLLSQSGFSYYGKESNACHLDLVPFATYKKWSYLSGYQREVLLKKISSSLGVIIKNSKIKLLLLNGRTVVEHLKLISNIEICEDVVSSLSLKRKSGNDIKGFEYTGKLSNISGIDIGRDIYIYGFNHNVQSSFGVSNLVKEEIKKRFNNYWMTLNHEL
ncbi:thymidylate synthase [Klebsiella variicola]|uniref:thymidylate synthase n=1 Tax=Klebsiella variicola TaxID=244366 RepID=UPI00069E90EC|nr:thymidylate synthase [Klebsiella variicola]